LHDHALATVPHLGVHGGDRRRRRCLRYCRGGGEPLVREAQRPGNGPVNGSERGGATSVSAAACDVGGAIWLAGDLDRRHLGGCRHAPTRGAADAGIAGTDRLAPFGAAMAVRLPPRHGNPVAVAMAALSRGARSMDFWLLTLSFGICGFSTNGLINNT